MNWKLPFGFTLSRNSQASSTSALAGRKVSGAPEKKRKPPSSDLPPKGMAGAATDSSRLSVETTDFAFTTLSTFDIFSNRKKTMLQALQSNFDPSCLCGMDFDEFVDMVADVSPEISKAVWDFLLMCNSGVEIKAYKPGTTEIYNEAQTYVDDTILKRLAAYNGTLGVFFDRIFFMNFLRGSFLTELVLDENSYDFVDIATPDTKTLSFRRINDPKRGQCWDFGQRQAQLGNSFVSLNKPWIKYVPLHPLPDSIEGRPIITPALFLAIFLMSCLRDIKRVIEHQGYNRLDVSVLFDKLKNTMPTDIQGDPAKITEWMQRLTNDVAEVFASLEPDDTYVHPDTVAINNPVGTVSADAITGIDGVFQFLERMTIRGLKSMPLLMGANQSRSETQANREWEIYAKGIETVQHPVEQATEDELKLACQAKGLQADISVRFAVFRAAEAMRDEQVDILRLKRARMAYDCGYISQDEAATIAVNKEKADVPEPRASISGGAFGAGTGGLNPNENPNPGEARTPFEKFVRLLNLSSERAPTLDDVEQAGEFLEKYGDDPIHEMYDADVVVEDQEQ